MKVHEGVKRGGRRREEGVLGEGMSGERNEECGLIEREGMRIQWKS